MAEDQRFKRLYPRRQFGMTCQVNCLDRLITGKIVDVSYNGVGIVLPQAVELTEAASVVLPERIRLRVRPVYNQPVSTQEERDRKSTRLNSSHLVISYAVFCLKKKKMTTT